MDFARPDIEHPLVRVLTNTREPSGLLSNERHWSDLIEKSSFARWCLLVRWIQPQPPIEEDAVKIGTESSNISWQAEGL